MAQSSLDDAQVEIARLEGKLLELEERRRDVENALGATLASTSWRLTAPARSIVIWMQALRERLSLFARALAPSSHDARANMLTAFRDRSVHSEEVETSTDPSAEARADYRQWVKAFDTLNERDRERIKRRCADRRLPDILVVYSFDTNTCARAPDVIERLRRQLYERWSAWLLVSADCAADDVERARDAARSDVRIKILQGPAGDRDSDAPTCVLLAEGTILLREHALYVFAEASADKERCLVYSDEDTLDPPNGRIDPFFKPRFSPELMRQAGYMGDCVLVRGVKSGPNDLLADFLSGPRSVTELVRDRLGAIDSTSVVHIPFILYHNATRRDVGVPSADEDEIEGEMPLVSIIIPTKDRIELLRPCLQSIRESTVYTADRLEILVVDNNSIETATIQFLQQECAAGRIRVLTDRTQFNYSHLNNLAVSQSRGEVLVFLNNDTVINDPKWLTRLVAQAMKLDVGAVGAKLVYPDHTVQHGGVVLGIHGFAGHAHVGLPEQDGGYQNLANVTREVTAVTGACLAMRRKVFDEIGGFDLSLRIAFGDVLLCLASIKRGYRNIVIGLPLVQHWESKTRGFDDTEEKESLFRRESIYVRLRHPDLFRDDPYYSPNLGLFEPYALASPPRARKPWVDSTSLRVLMLSSTCEAGHGTAIVVNLQAAYLATQGYDVVVAGPRGENDLTFNGCRRVYLDGPHEAAVFAVANDISCIVAHTHPFFSVARWLGAWPRTIMFDHGEADPKFFLYDAAIRLAQRKEKQIALSMAYRLYAISPSMREASGQELMKVIPPGTAHLVAWTDEFKERRAQVRAQRGWADKIVVLNICDVRSVEYALKGIDRYIRLSVELQAALPLREIVFVLAGKMPSRDTSDLAAQGLTVVANVCDTDLIDLYFAADVYANFSRWEGYNLGIWQALALGLPVIASDIPAHRGDCVETSDDPSQTLELMLEVIGRSTAVTFERHSLIPISDEPLAQLAADIEALCRAGDDRDP